MFPTVHGIAAQAGENVATYQVITTGAATHTINSFGVSASTLIDWGDGNQNTYTGTAQRTHSYAGAGTWTVTIYTPENVTIFDMRDTKCVLKSEDIALIENVTTFIAIGLHSTGTFNSADVTSWNPTTFYLISMPTGYTGTFNSVDVSAWNPTAFYLYSMPTGYAGAFNSVDVTAWRPSNFQFNSMPAGYAGTFNSADVSAWTPTTFYLHSMPTGYTGTFDSADVSAWRPANFFLANMPTGYGGTFNSVDISAWRPSNFQFYSMPTGYAGTFNSVDVSAWRPFIFLVNNIPTGYTGTFDNTDVSAWNPSSFYLHDMPTGYTITASGGFSNWRALQNLRIYNNNLLTAVVDAILWELHQASTKPRTATGGSILIGGSNQAPSGTFQAAAACPVTVATPGKEVAYELLNDSCGAFTNHWATVTITA